MPKFRIHIVQNGYYEVTAKNEDEAYEQAHNGIPEPILHVEHERTESIEIITPNIRRPKHGK